MVPPWVDAIDAATGEGAGSTPPNDTGQQTSANQDHADSSTIATVQSGSAAIAPAARFRGARLSLGSFARSGDTSEMRRGIGRYVRNGYGGGGTATRRFGSTTTTAGRLHDAVSGGAAPAPDGALDRSVLAGRSVREVVDAIVEAVRPTDGTQDAEASRASIRDAMSELLTKFVDADPLNLDVDQREFVIERFVAADVYRRLVLDVGRTIQDKAPSATTGLARLKQIREYVRETIAASFRKLREAGRRISTGRVSAIVRDAVRETMSVFEAYAE